MDSPWRGFSQVFLLCLLAGSALAQPVGYQHEIYLPRSHTLDLETGETGGRQADLEWNQSREGTYLAALRGASFGPVENKRIAAGRGTRVTVRTAEGNLAELRIVSVSRDGLARIEWTLWLR